MILVGGYNVYPREVEEVLYQHEAVAEAVVIGVPDPNTGEAVVCYISLRNMLTSIKKTSSHIVHAIWRNISSPKRSISLMIFQKHDW